MNNIKNMTVYTSGMAKSLVDKIYFMSALDDTIKYVIDFGCADGTMINLLAQMYPDITFFGYDNSSDMIKAAREKNKSLKNAFFSDDMVDIDAQVSQSMTAIVLSSVIHEVYSYGEEMEISDLWDMISHYKYVCIREMCLSNDAARRSAFIPDVAKLYSSVYGSWHVHLAEFENKWGSIGSNKNLIHYLLKYRYDENWSREVNENYLPLTKEEILAKIPYGFECVYCEHYILPFLASVVQKDFGITLKDATHLKLVLRRNDRWD